MLEGGSHMNAAHFSVVIVCCERTTVVKLIQSSDQLKAVAGIHASIIKTTNLKNTCQFSGCGLNLISSIFHQQNRT